MTTDAPRPALQASGRTLPALIRAGVLDAELAALAWITLEGRVPLLVAGAGTSAGAELAGSSARGDSAGTTAAADPVADPAAELAAAFVPLLPSSVGRASLGASGVEGNPASDVLVAGRLTGGDLRRAVRGAGRGFGIVAAVAGATLAEVLDLLRSLPVGGTEATIGRLGVVLVVGADPPHRVTAAHYLRPEVRDAGGHLRHLGPAVLATWDEGHARFDHFGWAVYPELAERLGGRAGDLEREHGERAAWLDHLATAGHGDTPDDLAAAIAARARRGPGH